VEALHYAIRKEIHNKPIAHQIDKARQRELWQWVGVTLLLAAVLLFLAWQHLELRWHGYRLEELKQEYAAEEQARRKLRLEIERLRSPERIETIATRDLHLVAPKGDDAVIVERVVPPEPPPASVVAKRHP
jgi:cell division protein FtsL